MLRLSLILLHIFFFIEMRRAAAEETDDYRTLFDGQSLAGWEGNFEVFRVQDGAIVGGSLENPLEHNEFLCTQREFADFELHLKAKLIGGVKRNAGIQFRSRRMPNHYEVIGYQADMGGLPGKLIWGCLYDESRRSEYLARPPQEKILGVLKFEDWNEYVIRCQGKRVQLSVNGVELVDYTEKDDSLEQTGIIGLQIHSGPPAEAWYKDIRIKEF